MIANMGMDPAVYLNQSLSSVPIVADSTVSLVDEDWFGSFSESLLEKKVHLDKYVEPMPPLAR